jgi:hypothetical protein
MPDHADPSEFRDVEQSALALAARIRRLRQTIGALSMLTAEVVGLQEALAALTPASVPQPAEAAAELGREGDAEATPPQLSAETASLPLASPRVNGAHNGSANGVGRPPETATEAASERTPISEPATSVAVTVSTQGGSVDLVRLYRALQRMPQTIELNLTSYNGGRAVVGLTTSASPRELPIEAALRDAFPEGVIGDWAGDAEFVAVITAMG